jgi:hypothetical protein
MAMNEKINLNTIILVLILLAIFACGGFMLYSYWKVVQPLEETGETLQKQIEELATPNVTPTIIADPVTIFHEVQSLSRLETVSYSVEKIITAESGQGSPFSFLVGDRLILVAHGQVIAGIDLGRMTEDDISVSGDGRVTVNLPPAEILVVTLDNQQTYIYDRDTGPIGMNPALESEARKAAEQEILDAALEDGILEMAQKNGEVYILRLVLSLGFDDIEFAEVTSIPTPSPTWP